MLAMLQGICLVSKATALSSGLPAALGRAAAAAAEPALGVVAESRRPPGISVGELCLQDPTHEHPSLDFRWSWKLKGKESSKSICSSKHKRSSKRLLGLCDLRNDAFPSSCLDAVHPRQHAMLRQCQPKTEMLAFCMSYWHGILPGHGLNPSIRLSSLQRNVQKQHVTKSG